MRKYSNSIFPKKKCVLFHINLIRTLYHRKHKICSRELFVDEINQIKFIRNKNSYSQEVVNKITNLNLKSLNKIKAPGHEKFLITLLLPYVNKNSRALEKHQSISK